MSWALSKQYIKTENSLSYALSVTGTYVCSFQSLHKDKKLKSLVDID